MPNPVADPQGWGQRTSFDSTIRHVDSLWSVAVIVFLVLGHAQFHLLIVGQVLEEAQADLLAVLDQSFIDTVVLNVEETDLGAGCEYFPGQGLSLVDAVGKGIREIDDGNFSDRGSITGNDLASTDACCDGLMLILGKACKSIVVGSSHCVLFLSDGALVCGRVVE